MRRRAGLTSAVAGLVIFAATSGCASTVSGTAVRDENSVPTDVAPLRASQLDDVLLKLPRLNEILGAARLELVLDSREMSDNAEAVSDPDCVGSIFGAEHQMYRSSEWTAVRDQVAREPGDGDEHWVEQTAVLHPTEQQARDFVETAAAVWRDCSGFSVAVDDDTTSSIWLIDEVVDRGDLLTQGIAQEDSEGWECQHALTAVANVSLEALNCAFGIEDEAVEVVDALVAKAAGR